MINEDAYVTRLSFGCLANGAGFSFSGDLGCSLADLPLHDCGVVASKREEVSVSLVEANLGHVAAVADQGSVALALANHGRVAEQFDCAVVVSRGNDLLTIGQGTIRTVSMVDV